MKTKNANENMKNKIFWAFFHKYDHTEIEKKMFKAGMYFVL